MRAERSWAELAHRQWAWGERMAPVLARAPAASLPCAAVLAALTATIAAVTQGVTPCADPALAWRCPDLVMAPPSHVRLERTKGGRRLLQMENRIVNVGIAPAEFFGQRTGPREMRARQVIVDGSGARRRVETGAELVLARRSRRAAATTGSSRTPRASSCGPRGRTGAAARWPASGPRSSAHCLRELRRPRRPADAAPAGVRRLQPEPAQDRGHARHVGRLGRRLPGLLSEELD